MVWRKTRESTTFRALLPVLALALSSALPAVPTTSSAAVPDTATHPTPATSISGPTLGDWSAWGHDLIGTRFAATENTITPANVGRLTEKWAFTFPRLQGVFTGSQPAVVGNTLYVGSSDAKVYALDSVTGATRWSFDLTTVSGPTTSGSNAVRDGLTVSGSTVYFGDSRGYLYALDRMTGALKWATA
jgi:polyvinyl alcohol dehydrogenase (cytochrome)